MGRTIGAAVGAVIVMLFFASLATRGRTVSPLSTPVAVDAQTRTAQKPAADLSPAQSMRHAH